MPPAEVAILFSLATGVAYGVWWLGARIDRRLRRRRTRRLGERNARAIEEALELLCVGCNKPVSPEAGDVFRAFSWWCKKCWEELL